MKKIQTVILLCLLLASLYACESRSLTQEDPQPVIGESIETPEPEPQEQEEVIPENAPAFYQTMQRVDEQRIFSLSTAQDLHDLSSWVAQGEETSDCIFVLQNDIDLENEPFTPIGTADHPFRGTFLGQGYTVSGLNVTQSEYNEPAGFFGSIRGYSRLHDLNVTGMVSGFRLVGGFAGTAGGEEGPDGVTYSSIENCSFTGTLHGGFVGDARQISILICMVDAEVCGQEHVGGFVGCLGMDSNIENCISLENVIADSRETLLAQTDFSVPDWGTQPSQDVEITVRYIGGFAGMNIGILRNCLSMGAVKTMVVAKTVGGFVGYESGEDTDCYYFMDYNAQWKAGYPVGDNASMTAQGLYYNEINKQENFDGWDFETIWQMGETHPELRTDFLTLDQYLSSDFSSEEQPKQSDNITGDSSSSNGAGYQG